MNTQVKTPHDVFMMPQRLLVPLFQRPYVWNEELQWDPLWKDIQRVANRLISRPGDQHQPHFLGAVVLQQIQNPIGDLQQRTIIDGQQRLTTIQILLDAIHSELEAFGVKAPSARIESLIENGTAFRQSPEDRFKVWPTNKDREPFNEVMGKEPESEYASLENHSHKLVLAHKFFSEQSHAWLLEDGEEVLPKRAEALEKSVRELLQMVVIELAPQENAQEIFETLNARGAVLTAADLIKNFIFQRLLEQGANVEAAYATYWKNFETAFWEEEISTGRVKSQRSSVFINQWLIAKLGEEIVAREVFSRFKTFADFDSGLTMPEILESLHNASIVYKQFHDSGFSQEPKVGISALFSYRTRVMESDVIRPLVIALTDPDQDPIPQDDLERCYQVVESWLIRRLLVRATTKAYNKIVPDVILGLKQHRKDPEIYLENYFRNQTVESSYWPDDEEVRLELSKLEFYRRIYRSRVRLVFEALEDYFRGWVDGKEALAGTRVHRAKFAIEHVMPVSWQAHWPLPSHVNEFERDKEVHTLGNLTLLTTKLNSTVSNSAWSEKKKYIDEHDLLQLNKKILKEGEDQWTDENIKTRTQEMIEAILKIWPAPAGHKVLRRPEAPRYVSDVTVSDLMSAGYIQPGQTLYARPGDFSGHEATILPDGRIEAAGEIRDSLSLAGYVLRKKNTNGWTFWRVDKHTQRTMADVRDEYEQKLGITRTDSDSEISEEDREED